MKTSALRRSHRLAFTIAVAAATLIAIVFGGGSAFAATVSSVTLTGGSGTATVAGMLYAKQGQTVTLAVARTPRSASS